MGDLVLQWVQQQIAFNTSAYDYTSFTKSIAVDSSGNVYVAYYTNGGTVSGGTNNGEYDIVVFKLSGTDGSLIWTQQQTAFNTSSYDGDPSITVDGSGNVYVAYYTQGGTVSGGTNNGGSSNDIVVFKLGTNGNLLWTGQQTAFNTNQSDLFPSIAVDSSGNVYVAYNTINGTVSGGTNNGSNDIVVFKLDGTNGNLMWTQQQTVFNTSSDDVVTSIAVDGLGNVYIAYWTDGGTVSGGTNNGGTRDIVVFKLDEMNGNLLWTQQQTAFNTSQYDMFPSIAVDGSSNVYVAYLTGGTVSGGTNNGFSDIVVFKLDGTNGNLLWIGQQIAFNTSYGDVFPSIAVDGSGNVYVTYYTEGGTVSGGTNNGNNYGGSRDIVVFKLSGTNGNLLWTQQQTVFNTSTNDFNPSIAVDGSGNVYVTYYTNGGTVSGGTNNANINGPSLDIVVFKLGLIPFIICVFPGALVFTTNGLKKIEDLRAGDIIFDEFDQQVELINNVECHPSSKGYTTFYQNCFALNFPSDNLMITDGHPIKLANSSREIPVERLTNWNDIIHREGSIPETYSLVTKERIFVPINNIPVCTWSESKFSRYAKKEKLEYTLL